MTTVLVIDDDIGFAEGLAASLRARNYRTFVDVNGDAALVTLVARGIDVAICDIVMPGLLGPGFLQKARSVRGNLPVVFMSTLPEERVSRMFQGYSGYVRKPFQIADLTQTIERVIARPRRTATAEPIAALPALSGSPGPVVGERG